MIIAKPMSFMNLSGGPLVAPERLLQDSAGPDRVVLHDELDLPFGTIRLKLGGGDNGHNGLRSVTSALGTRDYYRVRVGIGRPRGPAGPGRLRADGLQRRRAQGTAAGDRTRRRRGRDAAAVGACRRAEPVPHRPVTARRSDSDG